jgi:hypothetical protein
VFSKLVLAWALMAACVVIHAAGLSAAMRWFRRRSTTPPRFWPWTRLFVQLAAWIVVLHLVEVGIWAWFYVAQQAMPDLHDALYFSGVTYTTTGYGDLVLPRPWRLLGAVEALTGILMCGWSTGFFVAAVSRFLGAKTSREAS